MVIFQDEDSQENFERGTSPTSTLLVKSQEGNSVPVDILIESGEKITGITIEVKHSNSGDVLLEETPMELSSGVEPEFTPDNFDEQDFVYSKTFTIPEDADLGEYYLIHRATIGGEEYKRTNIINVVDVYEDYN